MNRQTDFLLRVLADRIRQVSEWSRLSGLSMAPVRKYNPSQPRWPAGTPVDPETGAGGGRFRPTDDDGAGEEAGGEGDGGGRKPTIPMPDSRDALWEMPLEDFVRVEGVDALDLRDYLSKNQDKYPPSSLVELSRTVVGSPLWHTILDQSFQDPRAMDWAMDLLNSGLVPIRKKRGYWRHDEPTESDMDWYRQHFQELIDPERLERLAASDNVSEIPFDALSNLGKSILKNKFSLSTIIGEKTTDLKLELADLAEANINRHLWQPLLKRWERGDIKTQDLLAAGPMMKNIDDADVDLAEKIAEDGVTLSDFPELFDFDWINQDAVDAAIQNSSGEELWDNLSGYRFFISDYLRVPGAEEKLADYLIGDGRPIYNMLRDVGYSLYADPDLHRTVEFLASLPHYSPSDGLRMMSFLSLPTNDNEILETLGILSFVMDPDPSHSIDYETGRSVQVSEQQSDGPANYLYDDYMDGDNGQVRGMPSDWKRRVSETLAEAAGISESEASDLIRQWAISSNGQDMRSLGIQEIAAELFDTDLSEWQRQQIEELQSSRRRQFGSMDSRYYLFERDYRSREVARDMIRRTLQAMYEKTQESLKESGIEGLRLYRGVGLNRDLADAGEGDYVEIDDNALSSWTTDYDTALSFSGVLNGEAGAVISAVIPASRVIGCYKTGFGCKNEYEFVVIGKPGRAWVEIKAYSTGD